MSRHPDPHGQPGTESALGDGALDEALDDLESIIGRRQADESPSGEGRGEPPGDAPPYVGPRHEAIHRHEPDSPLDETGSRPDAPSVADASASACERVAERLASEVEVIVNARLESAVREALAEVHREVRNHIAIVLPELLDEILGDDDPRQP